MLLLWLLDILEGLSFVFGVLVTFTLVLGICMLIYRWDNREVFTAEDKKYFQAELDWWKNMKKILTACLIIIFFLLLTPSKQTILILAGSNLIKPYVTTERMQKIDKIIDLELDKRLESYNVGRNASK